MKFIDGQIFFALIVALVLAWIASLLVARRYTAIHLNIFDRLFLARGKLARLLNLK